MTGVFDVSRHGSSAETMVKIPRNRWTMTRKDMHRAIKHSGSSSPGPDGIPYLAWRSLGGLGTNCLYDVARALTQEKRRG